MKRTICKGGPSNNTSIKHAAALKTCHRATVVSASYCLSLLLTELDTDSACHCLFLPFPHRVTATACHRLTSMLLQFAPGRHCLSLDRHTSKLCFTCYLENARNMRLHSKAIHSLSQSWHFFQFPRAKKIAFLS